MRTRRWQRGAALPAVARAAVAVVVPALVLTGCTGSTSGGATPSSDPSVSSVGPEPVSALADVELPLPAASSAKLGGAKALQAVIDGVVADSATLNSGVLGVTAAVVSAEGTWAGAAGKDGAGQALRPDTVLALGSITKTAVAAEVVHLAATGRLDLDKPASNYLSSPLLKKKPTVRQLLSMRSGIPEFDGRLLSDARRRPTKVWSAREALGYVPDGDLQPPGGAYQYATSNYWLLGLLIEKVTGKAWAAAVGADVLGASSGLALQARDGERPSGRLAAPSPALGDRPDGEYVPNAGLASIAGAGGAMAGTALATARYGYGLYGGRTLPVKQVRELATAPDDTAGYGLGTGIKDRDGDVSVGHQGDIPTFLNDLEVIPQRKLSVALLMVVDPTVTPEPDPSVYTAELVRALGAG
ncbi:serine hydrolase domain-containing protein [Spongisporangium articulatum]|uniref:Serine hydrolase domain-containing protein n=1 Tax=Spongisporangium articulatum TaxID=3362603 RepID=A0ABW8AKC5_9ACTN